MSKKAHPKVERLAQSMWLRAARNGDAAMLMTALSQGADPACTDENQYTALHIAAYESKPDVAKLLAKLCPLEAANCNGDTALEVAVARGHTRCAKILLKAGANPAPLKKNGKPKPWTLFHTACYLGHIKCAELLAPLLDVRALTPNGETALDLARSTRHGIEPQIEALIRKIERDEIAKAAIEGAPHKRPSL